MWMQQLIDLRTLMFISGITSVLTCVCMLYVYFTQRTYAGFRSWVMAFCSLAFGMVLVSLRSMLPDFFSIIIGNILLGLFSIFLAFGLTAFAGLKPRIWMYAAAVILLFASHSYFTYTTPDVNIRIIIHSLFVVVLCSSSLVIVVRDVPRILPKKSWFLIVYFSFNGLWFFLRMIRTLWGKTMLSDLMAGGLFEKMTMIISVEVSVICAVGLITINSRRVSHELALARDEIKALKGFIPICASCKKIRDDKGYWNQLEKYISEHTDAQFSHGICPECANKLYASNNINISG
jgi:hypothetical protein